jgi:2,3-bisphosphoglycerate-independent phosphoglycerate mutase
LLDSFDKDETMADLNLMRGLTRNEGGKILLLVMDGLGGLPRQSDGLTELEAARTPNMDRLAREGSVGLSIPVTRGITPGSGPAHFALFGYDPLEYNVGRGVLSAVGVGVDVGENDVAARGNFATIDQNGLITDRRAGRIPTSETIKRLELLRQIKLPQVEVELVPEKEYRFVMVMRGKKLNANITDTDPQVTGKPPLCTKANEPEAHRTAEIVNRWVSEARQVLQGQEPANMVLRRGFASDPRLPKWQDIFKLKAACVAVYPMYKGIAKLVGMEVIETKSEDTPADQFKRVAQVWPDYDFVFCHIKQTDSRGEDGNFDAKVAVIEAVDSALPALLDLNPAVLIVTGDHSTPAKHGAHSWHPVPTLLYAPETHMPDRAQSFGERECLYSALGQFYAVDMMPMALAHAKRLEKFGA